MKNIESIYRSNYRLWRCLLLLFIASGIVILPIMAQTKSPPTGNPILDEGIRLHDAARNDPGGNLEQGKKILGSLKDSSNLARAYYGSIITIEAGTYADRKNAIKATSLLSEGTSLIDDAVQKEPDNAYIRFLRMINSYEVSINSPLNRFKTMKEDIDWFSSRKATFSAAEQGIIELYRGLYCVKARKLEEALDAFNACIAISPGSPEAKMAKEQIAKYTE